MVASIKSEVFWAITATPLIEKIADIRGLGGLIWYFNYPRIDVPLPAGAWSLPESYTVADFDPVNPGSGPITGTAFLQRDNPAHKRAVKLWDEGFKFWYLYPEILRQVGSKGFGQEHSVAVVSHLLQYIQTRRTMRTPIELPNGKIVRPGDGIPGLRVRQREVSFKGELARQLSKTMTTLLSTAFSAVTKDKGRAVAWIEDKDPEAEAAAKREEQKSKSEIEQAYGVVGSAKGRVLELVSFDLRNNELFKNVRAKNLGNSAIAAVLSAKKINTGTRHHTAADPILGAVQVENIINQDRDAGLTLQWYLTSRESGMICPADRMAQLSFILSKSAILTAGVIHMWGLLKEQRRVIMMTDNPWAQQ